MNILSINFGHDASFALFEGKRLAAFEELERRSRYKYHFGMKAEYVEDFLAPMGLKFDDIDLVTLCSTQGYSMAHCSEIGLVRAWSPQHARFTAYDELWDDGFTEDRATRDPWYEAKHVIPQGLTASTPSPVRSSFGFSYLQGPDIDGAELARLASAATTLNDGDVARRKAHFLSPFLMRMRGLERPAFYVNHHACHAYYAHFYSASQDSMVSTHDGAMPWQPFHSGGFYLSLAGKGVIPLASPNLGLGRLYDEVGEAIGVGEAGKLMGLSAYASPSTDILELRPECFRLFNSPHGESGIGELVDQIIWTSRQRKNLRTGALRKFRFDLPDLETAAQAAANTQYLVQTIFIDQLSSMTAAVQATMPEVSCLDLAGGFTLNCPSNSLLQKNCPTLKVNPLPAAGDTGIAVGAGVAVMDFLGIPTVREIDAEGLAAAFPPSNIDHNTSDTGSLHGVIKIDLPPGALPAFIADRLADGKVLCLHRGRSEVGPRALGHRSIVAHAISEKVRDRINAAKGRESWRPLAPICRREDFHDYFAGDPSMGRFMLFTCDVLGPSIPAVTHVDGTARVQCIDARDEWLHPALGLLKAAGHPPIIINTSFNCAGEPIVETLEHAVASFLRMGFDYLVTEVGVFRRHADGADALAHVQPA